MEDFELLENDLDSEFDKKVIELISANKFILLFILSFGLYGIWWMYKSWKFFKEKEALDIMPVARAIFAIIFTFSLFEEIQKYSKSKGYGKSFSSIGLFIAFLLINISSKLPDPYWLISLLSFIPLIQPLKALNFAIANSENYNGIEQIGFNPRQILIIICGAIFWALVLIGLSLPGEY